MRFYGFEVTRTGCRGKRNARPRHGPEARLGVGQSQSLPARRQSRFTRGIAAGSGPRGEGRRSHYSARVAIDRLRMADLGRLRLPMSKVAPFVVTPDHRPRGLDGLQLAARLRPPVQGSAARLMRAVLLAHETDWDGWRRATRALVLANVAADQIVWSVRGEADLLAEPAPLPVTQGTFNVPRGLVELGETAIQAREPERFAWMYRLVLRAHRGERHILENVTDPEVQRVHRLGQAVRRDTHKMRAFLRFRSVEENGTTRYVAWFEPSHYIVEANAPFFVRRFATMTWSILTPYRSAHWDGASVTFEAGARTRRRAGRRCAGRILARLLQQHFQSCSLESRRDAVGDAEEILAELAGGGSDSGSDPVGIQPHRTDAGAGNASSEDNAACAGSRPGCPGGNRRVRGRRWPLWRRKRPNAGIVRCGSPRPRPYSGRGRRTRA